MISQEILAQLVPSSDPTVDFPRDPRLLELDRNDPTRRIGLWAAYLRYVIHTSLRDNGNLQRAIETSGFLGIGVFRAPIEKAAREYRGFPVVGGYQFGAVLLRAQLIERQGGAYFSEVALEKDRYSAPFVQLITNFLPQNSLSDGHVSAFFHDNVGRNCGITAAHVVEKHRLGQKVPINCSECGDRATLVRKAPGLIDAAVVAFRCGGSASKYRPASVTVRPVLEGETIDICFGESGRTSCTVMLALQTSSEIICAATPKHFLTNIHGHEGDSGSLVTAHPCSTSVQELLGMYLGETDCEDGAQNYITYGYALDLKQAADLFGASIISGEFNE